MASIRLLRIEWARIFCRVSQARRRQRPHQTNAGNVVHRIRPTAEFNSSAQNARVYWMYQVMWYEMLWNMPTIWPLHDDFISIHLICRIISIYLPSIASTKLILLNCNKNSVKCKAFCIQINLVKSRNELECFIFFFCWCHTNASSNFVDRMWSKICRPSGVHWWIKRTKYFNRRSNEQNIC